MELKLADFGLMNFFNGEKGDFLTTKCGTPGYMAPEMINEVTQCIYTNSLWNLPLNILLQQL